MSVTKCMKQLALFISTALSMRSIGSRQNSALTRWRECLSLVTHGREASLNIPKLDVKSLSPKERQELRLRSKAIPLVVDHDPLDIIFEDDDLLVVSKPNYVKVHPAHRFEGGTLLNRCIGYLGIPPYIIHRLDMHTSGVILFAKQKDAAINLAEQFKTGTVRKEYLCIVDRESDGPPRRMKFHVDKPVQRTTNPQAPKFARECGNSRPDSKPALTKFIIHSFQNHSALLRVQPETGRTHQIRLHADAAGAPIVGDDLYGREKALFETMEELRESAIDPKKERYLYGDALRCGLKLHAWTLTLTHPTTQSTITFTASVPHHFAKYAQKQGLTLP